MIPAKPLPSLDDPVTAPFWEAANKGRFVLQQCSNCQLVRWPPAPICPGCLSDASAWNDMPTTGEAWSYVFYHRPYLPSFADELPYCVAMVRLDAGPTMISRVLKVTESTMRIGMRVEASFDRASPEVTIVNFVPSSSSNAES